MSDHSLSFSCAGIENAAEFALSRRVLLLRAGSGVGLDIALGGLPFEESAVARSSLFGFPGGVPLRTAPPRISWS
jgi:hypothetical protein